MNQCATTMEKMKNIPGEMMGRCEEVMGTKCHMIILEKETDQYIQDYIAGHKLRFHGGAIMDICQKYRVHEWFGFLS